MTAVSSAFDESMAQTKTLTEEVLPREFQSERHAKDVSTSALRVAVLTGCQDRHYACGLVMALAAASASVDVIGSDDIDSHEMHETANVRFHNFGRGQSSRMNLVQKLWRVFVYYANLLAFALRPSPPVFHILWNYKLELFDRTVQMVYFKALGKKVTLTAHNVNQARRDLQDSWLNRITLKIQYQLCDHIFVHTAKMKDELCQAFGVSEDSVSVLRYPINDAFANTELTAAVAKRHLGLKEHEKAILFLGRIVPYKGLEYLLEATCLLMGDEQAGYRLIVAGEPKKESEQYLKEIQEFVGRKFKTGQIILRMEFIPDDEMELYLKGADVLVLPYKEIFQSGVLFLAYTFGLPVVATDVGSFREEIIQGRTGFLCKPGDSGDLAAAIAAYFRSDLFENLAVRRRELQDYAEANHSWRAAAEIIRNAYAKMLNRKAL